jgi:hypothetical protein
LSFAEQILRELRRFFDPLEDAVSSPAGLKAFLAEFGHDVAIADAQAASGGLSSLNGALGQVVAALGEPDREEDDPPPAAPEELQTEEIVLLGDAARGIFTGLRDLPQLLPATAATQTLFLEIWDYLSAQYAFERAPALYRVLVLLGVIELDTLVPGVHPEARDVAYLRRRLHWDRAGLFLKDPAALMRDVYGWTTAEFDAAALLTRLADVLEEFGIITTIRDPDPALRSRFLPPAGPLASSIALELPLVQERAEEEEALVELGLLAMPIKGDSATDTGIGLMPYATGAVAPTRPISADGSLKIASKVSGAIAGTVVFAVRPSGPKVEAGIAALAANASLSVDLTKTPLAPATSLFLLGEPGKTRLEAGSVVLSAGADATTAGDGDVFVAAGIGRVKLVVEPGEDGLLAALLSGPVEAEAGDVVLGWRPGRGIYFERSAGLSLRIPINVDVGSVLRLRELGVALLFDSPPQVEVDVSGDLTVGPLMLGVERLGIKLRIIEDSDGILGKYGVDAGIKAPTGYLASLDGGPFQGGGALSVQDHEYRGMLALQFESFGLSAFGILTTRLPTGQQTFSFLAAIFGELDIQLGFGFRLTGIGGLLGIHRTANVDALREVLATGRLDGLLFPREPVQDAAVILQDLATVFPAKTGQHLFGPAARIAWGTPALIQGKLGLVLELGREKRLVILGAVEAFLPSHDAAIVFFSLDFIGTVEFATGAIDFRGTLKNSRILTWPVSGEAAVQTGWGESAGLVASIGGLHPSFPTPAGFPNLARLTINFATDNPSLTLQAYMALTLNSVQAGASASLYVRGPKIRFVGRFEVEGWVGFDALITFDPFAFDVALRLGLRLLLDGDVLCGISGDLRLTGPNEYVIRGRVSVDVCGVGVGVGVNHRWGDKVAEIVNQVSGLDVLRRVLQNAKGIEPVASSTLRGGVAYAEDDPSDATVVRLDPSGGLRFVQRELPLAVRLDHVGSSRLSDGLNEFDLELTDVDGDPILGSVEQGDFAAGVFFDLSEGERLSGDPFVRHKRGVRLHAADVLECDVGTAEDIDDEYETVFLGEEPTSNQVLLDAVRPPAEWLRYVAAATEPSNPSFVPKEQTAGAIGVRPKEAIVAAAAVSTGGVRPRLAEGAVISGAHASLRRRFPGARIVASHLSTAGGEPL